jgi:hypothetical protein
MKLSNQGLLALLAFALLSALVIERHTMPSLPPARMSAALLPPSRPATLFERSLRQAWKLRSRALLEEIREREALESWDPTATAGLDEGRLRRESLASDASGDLRRARTAARPAAALARTTMEAGRAASLLVLIERDLGLHQRDGAARSDQWPIRGGQYRPVRDGQKETR